MNSRNFIDDLTEKMICFVQRNADQILHFV